ncbi:hypothetical protein MSG28_004312, partial [Choristoneura fumiferana]
MELDEYAYYLCRVVVGSLPSLFNLQLVHLCGARRASEVTPRPQYSHFENDNERHFQYTSVSKYLIIKLSCTKVLADSKL